MEDCISRSSPGEMEPTECTWMYFKELTHVTVVVWQIQNPQGRLAGWRPREEFQFKSSLLAELSLIFVKSVFILLRPSID